MSFYQFLHLAFFGWTQSPSQYEINPLKFAALTALVGLYVVAVVRGTNGAFTFLSSLLGLNKTGTCGVQCAPSWKLVPVPAAVPVRRRPLEGAQMGHGQHIRRPHAAQPAPKRSFRPGKALLRTSSRCQARVHKIAVVPAQYVSRAACYNGNQRSELTGWNEELRHEQRPI